MPERMTGKRVLVTGAAGGIGLATVRLLAQEGARILATDLNPDGAQALRDIPGDIVVQRQDIGDPPGWPTMLDIMAERWGGIDVLVNNAAYLSDASLLDLVEDQFRRHIDVNLIGTWLGMRACAAAMIAAERGGAIINLSSVSGMIGHPNRGAYAATKWAIRGLTRTAALEWAPHDIRVCAIVPGPIDTPMSRRARGRHPDESMSDVVLPDIPLRRFGSADDVAEAILYLASDSARYVTGSELVVDGGCLLQR
jgi:3alpha(or 20beta)-hydroxysteroid dehydrogenase